MKPITHFIQTLLLIVLTAWIVPSFAGSASHPDHSSVLPRELPAGILPRIQSICPGMTRADLSRVFVPEGGESLIYDAEFVYAVAVQFPRPPQTETLLGISNVLVPETWEMDPETWSILPHPSAQSLRPLFLNGQCIKVRVKFAPDDSLITLPVRPYRSVSPSDWFDDHRNDVILSISAPYWGDFYYD